MDRLGGEDAAHNPRKSECPAYKNGERIERKRGEREREGGGVRTIRGTGRSCRRGDRAWKVETCANFAVVTGKKKKKKKQERPKEGKQNKKINNRQVLAVYMLQDFGTYGFLTTPGMTRT